VCTLGDLLEDVVVHLAGPVAHGSDTRSSITHHRGGSAANVAVAAARSGAPARFLGQVGADARGDALLAALSRDGVESRVVRRGRTGTLVVLVEPGGERTMLADRGAAAELTPGDVDPAWLAGAAVLHLPAYSLCEPPLGSAALALSREAARRGIPRTVDASSVAVLGAAGPEEFLRLLADIAPSVVFANTAEADLLGVARGAPLPGAGLTVVKRGGEPALLVSPTGTVEVPARPVPSVLDSTGAGDAFAGAFLAALLRGAGPEEATAAGHTLAARGLAERGA